MALKYIDGFEQYASYPYPSMVSKSSSISSDYAWTGTIPANSRATIITSVVRTPQANSACAQMWFAATGAGTFGGYFFMKIPTNETIIVGFGLNPYYDLTNGVSFLNFNNSGTTRNTAGGLHVEIMADGSIRLYNEGTNAVIAVRQEQF